MFLILEYILRVHRPSYKKKLIKFTKWANKKLKKKHFSVCLQINLEASQCIPPEAWTGSWGSAGQHDGPMERDRSWVGCLLCNPESGAGMILSLLTYRELQDRTLYMLKFQVFIQCMLQWTIENDSLGTFNLSNRMCWCDRSKYKNETLLEKQPVLLHEIQSWKKKFQTELQYKGEWWENNDLWKQ